MRKITAVELLEVEWSRNYDFDDLDRYLIEKAKIEEREQILNLAKKAYIAGQKTMYCGCYDIQDATTFEEWLIKHELNKSE